MKKCTWGTVESASWLTAIFNAATHSNTMPHNNDIHEQLRLLVSVTINTWGPACSLVKCCHNVARPNCLLHKAITSCHIKHTFLSWLLHWIQKLMALSAVTSPLTIATTSKNINNIRFMCCMGSSMLCIPRGTLWAVLWNICSLEIVSWLTKSDEQL